MKGQLDYFPTIMGVFVSVGIVVAAIAAFSSASIVTRCVEKSSLEKLALIDSTQKIGNCLGASVKQDSPAAAKTDGPKVEAAPEGLIDAIDIQSLQSKLAACSSASEASYSELTLYLGKDSTKKISAGADDKSKEGHSIYKNIKTGAGARLAKLYVKNPSQALNFVAC